MNMETVVSGKTRAVTWMGTEYVITLDKAASAGLIGVFEGKVPAGEGPPIHIHHNEDEVLHILEGEYEFWLDGETSRAGPGATVFLPRGVPHTFRVDGDTHGRNLAILTPGGFEEFFVEAAARDLRIPEHMGEVVELAGRYGLEFTGPPPWA
jgi:quercetin dioxygenase-like cupin family protein